MSWSGRGEAQPGKGPVVVVHGGAGGRLRELHQLRGGCARAAAAGLERLSAGGSALDAVEAAVRVLEDDPLFNAGVGSALNEVGVAELDASVMEGNRLRAGAVAGLVDQLNPVSVARAILEDGRNVFLIGEGAGRFAREAGFPSCQPSALQTDRSRRRLRRVMHPGPAATSAPTADVLDTVGAVAYDHAGHVAAATSTGGLVGKHVGRVGDAPIIGAGTYADDRSGACSVTGEGEQILRAFVAAHAVNLLGSDLPAREAAAASVARLGERFNGKGGVILVDRNGTVGIARNTDALPFALGRPGGVISSGG